MFGIDDTTQIRDECLNANAVTGGRNIDWWSSCEVGNSCFSVGMPNPAGRPNADTDGPDIDEIFVAIRSFGLGSRNLAGEYDLQAWQEVGFDIDGVCTDSSSCAISSGPQRSCLPASANGPPRDGPFCIDNQTAQLIYLLDTEESLRHRYAASDAELNCALCAGQYSVLIRIRDYNGQPNDPVVRIDVYGSPGLVTPRNIDCRPEGGIDAQWTPNDCWRASDEWTIRDGFSSDPTNDPGLPNAVYSDPGAFVRDGGLFARLPKNGQLWFPSGDKGTISFPIVFSEGTLTGSLVETEDGWAIENGTYAGSTKASDLIAGLQFVGLCPDTAPYMTMALFIQNSVDVLSTGDNLPDVPCDALSAAFHFTATAATPGPVVDFPLPEPVCAPSPEAALSSVGSVH